MKHLIYPELQGTITATSENVNYPATNLVDSIRKNKWKADTDVQSATLRVPIAGTATTPGAVLGLDNTNAETAIISITLDSAEVALTDGQPAVDLGGGLVKIPAGGHGLSEGGVCLVNGTAEYDGVHTLPTQAAGDASNFVITATYAAETFSNTDTVCEVIQTTTHSLGTGMRAFSSAWEEYTAQTAAHTATIKLTAGTGETVEAGIVRAGGLVTIKNPEYGITEDKVKYHIVIPYKSGVDYTKKIYEVRVFSYQMALARDTEFRDLQFVCDYYGPSPFMMLLADSLDDDPPWVVFGKIVSGPGAGHGYPAYCNVNMTVQEVV